MIIVSIGIKTIIYFMHLISVFLTRFQIDKVLVVTLEVFRPPV
jgi:hypothetical protein